MTLVYRGGGQARQWFIYLSHMEGQQDTKGTPPHRTHTPTLGESWLAQPAHCTCHHLPPQSSLLGTTGCGRLSWLRALHTLAGLDLPTVTGFAAQEGRSLEGEVHTPTKVGGRELHCLALCNPQPGVMYSVRAHCTRAPPLPTMSCFITGPPPLDSLHGPTSTTGNAPDLTTWDPPHKP